MHRLLILLLLPLLAVGAERESKQKTGILISSASLITPKPYTFQPYVIEPGAIITYIQKGDMFNTIQLVGDGREGEQLTLAQTILYEPPISPSRIYLLLREQGRNIWSEDQTIERTNRYLLLKNTLANFPNHPLKEELLAMLCRAAEQYEAWVTDTKTSFAITIEPIRQYLKEFPKGLHQDELKWLLVRLENHQYEYEGNATGPISQVKAYENFLSRNLNSTVADQIRLEIARLCRIAVGFLDRYKFEDLSSEDFNRTDSRRLREKAKRLFKALLVSDEGIVRETSRVNLYEMEHPELEKGKPPDS